MREQPPTEQANSSLEKLKENLVISKGLRMSKSLGQIFDYHNGGEHIGDVFKDTVDGAEDYYNHMELKKELDLTPKNLKNWQV